jgi:nicotinamidase-related amidase
MTGQTRTAQVCSIDDSLVVFVDIQERLIGAMEGNNAASVVNNASRLLQAAQILDVPVLFTEQSPEKIGGTHPTLLDARPSSSRMIEKTTFSACDTPEFLDYLDKIGRRQMIVCGMETHVCVLQTTLGLLNAGYDVFIVEDAVCSRFDHNRQNGISRMQACGAHITSRESVLFEWMRDSQHPRFREISKKLIV